ncbi:MAG: 3-deoxy-D-manno-octulosonic acid transferase, partial [Pyrinomonadaceae bacterium]|nr:3-deoxy-D-manno-octulosonic acid transferase [Pyrinomonadaceae bacterium]
KYASGFMERLGNYPEFVQDRRPVIWLHCVSVGEANAARPLVDGLLSEFPEHRVIVSTTTRTGQELAKKIFAGKADAVFYFPFDWKFSVRRALEVFKPAAVLLMETEIWPRFIHEAKIAGAKVAIVNGRLSQRSFDRYSRVRPFVSRVLNDVDLALMQAENDADRIKGLGIQADRVEVTGNIKFDQVSGSSDAALTEHFRNRFRITAEKPLIVAASTHEPEERYVLKALEGVLGHHCRLMLVPRHPERFHAVEALLKASPYTYVRRSADESHNDKDADVILLDTIGELRSVYPLAEIVFVGGSLIPHGGQSVLEPAVEGKAIVSGPYTHNFDSVVKEFLKHDAIIQTGEAPDGFQISERLHESFTLLLEDRGRRSALGQNAAGVMAKSGGDATPRTIRSLRPLIMGISE